MKHLHLWSLSALLILTGCATTTPDSDAPTEQAGHTPTSTEVPHTPRYPSGPLSPIGSTSIKRGNVANLEVPDDLWVRIRQGFAMPDLQTDLVSNQEQWYASRPDYIQRMTQRSSKYMFHIVEELERRGMPSELALLPYIESAYNPQAVSSAKAAGMWQFMPATGTYFDLKQNMFRDDRRDVLASTRAALDYLQKLYNMFGDWHLALAAYNWGEGSVGRAIARNQKQGLGTSYLDLNMPDETRNYVPKLQAVKNIIAQPERFQAELPLIENHPYFQAVTLDRDIDTALVAELAGISMDELRSLNPSFNKPVIFKAGTPQVLLPWDTANAFRRNQQAHEKGQYASWTVWTVPTTMTVAAAANTVGMSENDLRSVNSIPPRMMVRAGSSLMVPRSAAVKQDVSSHLADNAHIALTPEIVNRRTTVKARKHDTVARVAQRYKVSASQVADWNDIGAHAAFKAGQQVILYLPVRVGSNESSNSRSAHTSKSSPSKGSAQKTARQTPTKAAPSKRSTPTAKKKR